MALDLNDKTSNGNNLTNNNTVAEITSSLPFAGSTKAAGFTRSSSQYLSITDAAQTGLDLTNNFTIEFLVKVTSIADGESHMIVSKFDSTPQLAYAVGLYRTGSTYQIRFYWTSNGDWATFNDYSKNLGIDPTGAWHHIAVKFSSATVTYLLDGSSLGTTTGSGNVYSGSSTFKIGTEGTNYSTVVLDEVRIWNVLRDNSDINTYQLTSLAGNESGLVAYWPFEALITTSIKKILGNTYATVKKVSSTTIATVKKIAGLA